MNGNRSDRRDSAATGHSGRLGWLGLLRIVALGFTTLAWTLFLGLVLAGRVGGPLALGALLALPGLLAGLSLLGFRSGSRAQRIALAWSGLMLVAAVAATVLEGNPALAAGPVVIAASALACSRYPAAAVVLLFALSGAFGSLKAFTGISPAAIADVILVGLWLSVLAQSAFGRPTPSRTAPWLSLIAVGAYIVLTGLEALASDDLFLGLQGFRSAAWYMATLVLIVLAGWQRETYRRIAVGMVAVVGLTCAYAVLRWIIGPAEVERELALATAGPFNFVGDRFRTFGATAGGHQLGLWAAVGIPIAAGAMIALRGRGRALATVICGLAIMALLVSEVRGTFAGAVVGVGLLVVLLGLAPGLGGRRLPIVVGSSVAMVTIGILAISLTAVETGTTERYTEILDPGDAQGLKDRQFKWAAAFEELDGSLFGRGIGTGGRVQQEFGTTINAASRSLDNSYVKVAYEQGFLVLAFFAVALLMLLGDLVRSALSAREPVDVAMMAGAAGVLTTMLVSMFSGLYIEDLLSLAAWLPIGVAAGYWLAAPAPASARAPALAPNVIGRPISSPVA